MSDLEKINKSPFRYLIFTCTNERAPDNPRGCCLARGGQEVLQKFKDEIRTKGLKNVGVRATKSGCLDQCETGVTVVVYGREAPFGVWYKKVQISDVPDIIESHIINGRPVERILNKWFSE
ncbi:MAG: ferredoxin [Candidatus Thorarchaeota archaeon]